MRCVGCGRLLGLRAEPQCPCWESHGTEALIPARLKALTRQYRQEKSRGEKKR